MLKLLLEHGAVRQTGEHIIEGELRDALLAFDDLADHLVEARREPRQFIVAAHPTCTCSPAASRPAASSSRASGCVIRPAARQVAKPTSTRPSSVMTASASCNLRASASASAFGISKEQDRLLTGRRNAGKGFARAIEVAPVDAHLEGRAART